MFLNCLFSHLVNSAIPCTIDTKKIISKFTLQASKVHLYLQNHVLALEGANKIKVKTINVGPEDLLEANVNNLIHLNIVLNI